MKPSVNLARLCASTGYNQDLWLVFEARVLEVYQAQIYYVESRMGCAIAPVAAHGTNCRPICSRLSESPRET